MFLQVLRTKAFGPILPQPKRIKGTWSWEEDAKITDLVQIYGANKWSFIASHVPGRIGKQCRER
jgi:hypothetical protein